MRAKLKWLSSRTDGSHSSEVDKLSSCKDSVNILNMESWCIKEWSDHENDIFCRSALLTRLKKIESSI